ncbi:COG2364 Predicted membrane protein [Candidatus Nanopelagicaceae bacterium]
MKFASIIQSLRPHKTVPITPWTAKGLWDLTPLRTAILFFGLAIFGLGDSLLIQGGVGNAPWTVFAQGLTLKTGLSIGWATFIISVCVMLLWIPLNERVGFGTISNIVIIATFIQVGTIIFPKQDNFAIGVIFDFIGIALVGLGSALYITCGLGRGPRDGAMTGIHYKTGIRVGRVRMAIEVTVLIIGWFLGGTVGLGTALFALLIGQSVAIFLGLLARLTHKYA